MTLCANNMLSLLGKQVYSIQLIDYSQDTCYPAMKNRKRTLRIRVGRRISTWQHSKPGKIRQKTLADRVLPVNGDIAQGSQQRTDFNSVKTELSPLSLQSLGCSIFKMSLRILLQNRDIPLNLLNSMGCFPLERSNNSSLVKLHRFQANRSCQDLVQCFKKEPLL